MCSLLLWGFGGAIFGTTAGLGTIAFRRWFKKRKDDRDFALMMADLDKGGDGRVKGTIYA